MRIAEAMPEITPAKIMDKRKMTRMIPKAMNFPFTGESAFLWRHAAGVSEVPEKGRLIA